MFTLHRGTSQEVKVDGERFIITSGEVYQIDSFIMTANSIHGPYRIVELTNGNILGLMPDIKIGNIFHDLVSEFVS